MERGAGREGQTKEKSEALMIRRRIFPAGKRRYRGNADALPEKKRGPDKGYRPGGKRLF